MAYVQRKIAFLGSPATNPETKPFWDGCAAGKLLVPKCTACGKSHWYPRGLCPYCFSDKLEWVSASGKGKIYTLSVMERAEVPYAIAYVTLAEGPSMMTNIVDCDPDRLAVGDPVQLLFATRAATPVPVFKPPT